VPIADSALLSAKIVKDAKLVVYKGAPHGMCTTLKDRVNADLPRLHQGRARLRNAGHVAAYRSRH